MGALNVVLICVEVKCDFGSNNYALGLMNNRQSCKHNL